MALGMLVDGQWQTQRNQEDQDGQFVRPSTTFRNWVSDDSIFRPEAGRYHLYISWACPWAHRTAILRQLKGLEDVISLSVVDPYMGEEGWAFSDYPGTLPDTVNQAHFLREVYLQADPNFTGRVTVPILWDKQTRTIVNNESREIMRMLDTSFTTLSTNNVDLFPLDLQAEIYTTLDAIYNPINNGVYRAGFATEQAAYEAAVIELFDALETYEHRLNQQRYLCGSCLTEADVCLFTTLLRFDAVYYGHFKCNLKRIVEYENLWNYLKDLYQIPAIKQTCRLDHIKVHYYRSHPNINPTGIVPKGPLIDFEAPHNRDRFN